MIYTFTPLRYVVTILLPRVMIYVTLIVVDLLRLTFLHHSATFGCPPHTHRYTLISPDSFECVRFTVVPHRSEHPTGLVLHATWCLPIAVVPYVLPPFYLRCSLPRFTHIFDITFTPALPGGGRSFYGGRFTTHTTPFLRTPTVYHYVYLHTRFTLFYIPGVTVGPIHSR